MNKPAFARQTSKVRSGALHILVVGAQLASVLAAGLTAPQTASAEIFAGTVAGTVYRDYNADGARGTSEPGVGGVTVVAFDATNTPIVTATTSAISATLGQYSLAIPGATTQVRVEFINLPSPAVSSQRGSGNGTSVQFVTSPASNVNFGINVPGDYCQNNPNLATNCYVGGDQSTASESLFGFPSATSGAVTGTSIADFSNPLTHSLSLPANQIGVTWGLGYCQSSRRLYTSAFFKRHAGFGPGGSGAVYVINPDTNAVVGTFTVPGTTNKHNTANYFTDNGNTGFNAVGTSSLGGLDVSDACDALFVMNVENKTLYKLNPTTGAVISSQAIPANFPACAAANVRPFAVEYYRDSVYVGAVCSGPALTDLRAYVYRVNAATLAFDAAPALNVSLNYARGFNTADPTDTNLQAEWNAWSPTFAASCQAIDVNYCAYPQPMFTGIAFDNGNMVLGLRDRYSDQTGYQQQSDPNDVNRLVTTASSGDILRACGSPDTGWTLENNGRCDGLGVTAQNNGEGPGNSEFFGGDTNGGHDELSLGGVVAVPGAPDIAFTSFNPIPRDTGVFELFSQGVRWANGTTGAYSRAYHAKDLSGEPLSFGKAAGMGDLAALCDAAPIEIGNRLWTDSNGNGVQDPGEPVLISVTVQLYATSGPNAGQLVATTTTDGNGNYYFNSAGADRTQFTGDDLGNFGADKVANTADDANLLGFKPSSNGVNNTYEVRVPLNQAVLTGYALTTANVSSNGQDTRDSDATLVGNNAVIAFATGSAGQNNHTYDVGFVQNNLSLGNRVWFDTNNDGSVSAGEVGVNGVAMQLYRDVNGDGVFTAGADGAAISTTTTANGGYYTFTNLSAGGYLVVITNTNFAPAAVLNNYCNSTATETGNSDLNDRDHGNVQGETTAGLCLGAGNLVASSVVTLTNGGEPTSDGDDSTNSNLTIDFGFYKLTLGNLVWNDLNNNGVFDAATETGINNVTVNLYRDTNGDDQPDGAAIATTTTANGGLYAFDVAAGDYIVEIVPPAGYRSSTASGYEPAPDPDGNTDNDDNGTTAGAVIRSKTISMTPGAEPTVTQLSGTTTNTTVDFGIWQPASLGNYVWNDVNRDGVQNEPASSGLNGVTVQIYNAATNQLVSSTVTANDVAGNPGYYTFTNLISGTYYVVFTPPAGFVVSPVDATTNGGNDGNDSDANPTNGRTGNYVLNAGDVNPTVDAGMYSPLLSLGNYVWYDTNDNGSVDAGEQPINGATVNLYRDNGDGVFGAGDVLSGTTTTVNGQYLFAGLAAGNYFVQIAPSNFVSGSVLAGYRNSSGANAGDANDNKDHGTPSAGNGVLSELVTLSVGGEPTNDGDTDANSNLTIDFGFYKLSLGNVVWNDLDNNGVKDGTELGLDNVTVNLLDANGNLLGTTQTSNGGVYQFTGLISGTYIVEIVPPAGYTSSTGAGQESDPNANGDNNDNGVTVVSGNIRSNPIVLTPGSEPTVSQVNGSTTNDTLDFGVYQQTLSLGDYVWYDTNDNGAVDAGEQPINNVAMVLWRDNGDGVLGAGDTQVGTQNTVNGQYLFTGLTPGNYFVQVAESNFASGGALANYRNSTGTNAGDANNNKDHGTPSVGNGVVSELVTLTSGGEPVNDGDTDPNTNRTIDFGFYTLTLGNQVFNDANNNGIKNLGENGVPSVTVRLLDANNIVIGTTTTDANGIYTFTNLATGSYSVEIVLPAGFSSSTDIATSGNPNNDTDNDDNGVQLLGAVVRSNPILLQPGAEPTVNPSNGSTTNSTLDFGIWQPASLGDRVWIDTDQDGVQDSGENGLPGVTVVLYDVNGTPVQTTTTGSNGEYGFTNLVSGTYSVGVVVPGGYAVSPQETTANGGNETNDSDISPSTGRTNPITLQPGENNPNQDAGLFATAPQLIISKRSLPLSGTGVKPGNSITYTLVVTNVGNTPVTNAVITDAIPAGTTYVVGSASNGGTFANGVLSWALFSPLAVQQSASVSFVVIVNAAQTTTAIVNQAFVRSTETPSTPSNVVVHPFQPAPVLVPAIDIAKTPDLQTVSVGATVTFTIRVTNTGSVDLVNVNVSDPKAPNCNRVIGDLAIGATTSYACALANVQTGFTNIASVTGTSAIDLNQKVTDTDDAVVQVNGTARIGDYVWLDTDGDGIQNPNAGVAGVVVRLQGPNATVIATTTTDATGYYSFENLPPGVYVVVFELPAGYSFTQPGSNPVAGNDSNANPITGATQPITVLPGTDNVTIDAGLVPVKLSLTKSSVPGSSSPTKPITVSVGARITYTLRVTNTGVGAANNVVITDAVPAGTTYVVGSATPAATFANGVLSWTFAQLASNQSVSVSFVVVVVESTRTQILNVGYVNSSSTQVQTSNEVQQQFQPTAITLFNFGATSTGRGIEIKWQTGSELNTFGFVLYRSTTDKANRSPISPMIPAQSTSGGNYVFVDETVTSGANYTYWLVEVETDGATMLEYEPIRATFSATPQAVVVPAPVVVVSGDAVAPVNASVQTQAPLQTQPQNQAVQTVGSEVIVKGDAVAANNNPPAQTAVSVVPVVVQQPNQEAAAQTAANVQAQPALVQSAKQAVEQVPAQPAANTATGSTQSVSAHVRPSSPAVAQANTQPAPQKLNVFGLLAMALGVLILLGVSVTCGMFVVYRKRN